jgi:hypothetical protein
LGLGVQWEKLDVLHLLHFVDVSVGAETFLLMMGTDGRENNFVSDPYNVAILPIKLQNLIK